MAAVTGRRRSLRGTGQRVGEFRIHLRECVDDGLRLLLERGDLLDELLAPVVPLAREVGARVGEFLDGIAEAS